MSKTTKPVIFYITRNYRFHSRESDRAGSFRANYFFLPYRISRTYSDEIEVIAWYPCGRVAARNRNVDIAIRDNSIDGMAREKEIRASCVYAKLRKCTAKMNDGRTRGRKVALSGEVEETPSNQRERVLRSRNSEQRQRVRSCCRDANVMPCARDGSAWKSEHARKVRRIARPKAR